MRFVELVSSIGLLVILGCFYLTNAAFPPSNQENWISQPLNHGNRSLGSYWQRYYVDGRYYTPGSPVFLYIGHEGEVNPSLFKWAFCELYAKNVKGLCVILEHRYYGRSRPLNPSDHLAVISGRKYYRPGTFRYLSSDQALNDISTFINEAKRKFGLTNNKWVVFGGSYSGTLAAWARQKFPNQIYAAVSSSAPMEASIDYRYFHQTSMQKTAEDDSAAWYYQTCTEFGWYNQALAVWTKTDAANFVRRYCEQYSENITVDSLQRGVENTNRKHGGRQFFVDRVVILHGDGDFWRHAGITKAVDQKRMPVYVIPGGRHCDDMFLPPSSSNVRLYQQETLLILKNWLR